MKRLAIALVLMGAVEGYAQGEDPYGFTYLPKSGESMSDYIDRKNRETARAFRESEEDFARSDQEYTNYKIREYMDEQRERQEQLDYERELRELGTHWD
jgi:uncharacterized FlgJ-related protein